MALHQLEAQIWLRYSKISLRNSFPPVKHHSNGHNVGYGLALHKPILIILVISVDGRTSDLNPVEARCEHMMQHIQVCNGVWCWTVEHWSVRQW